MWSRLCGKSWRSLPAADSQPESQRHALFWPSRACHALQPVQARLVRSGVIIGGQPCQVFQSELIKNQPSEAVGLEQPGQQPCACALVASIETLLIFWPHCSSLLKLVRDMQTTGDKGLSAGLSGLALWAGQPSS